MKSPSGKRILYISNQYEFFLAHRLPFAQAAHKQGYEVLFASPGPMDKILKPEAHPGITYIPLELQRKSRMPWTEWRTFSQLMQTIREVQPAIIHNFTIKPVVYGSLAGVLLGVPRIINTITGLGSVYIKKSLGNWLTQSAVGLLYKVVFRSPRIQVIFQNPDDRNLFLERGYITPDRSTVILGSGVDVQKFTPSPEPQGPITIVYPGRMLWDKGVGDLVEAGKILESQGHQFEIHFCGPIDYLNPTGIPEQTIQEWQNLKWFKWKGVQKDMPRTFSECHIVCLPSYREGVPIALLEAAASSRAIVTTEAPGCREVVKENVNGFKVPVAEPKALAEAISKLIRDASLRQRMGTEGRKIASLLFSRDQVIRQVLSVYTQVMTLSHSSVVIKVP